MKKVVTLIALSTIFITAVYAQGNSQAGQVNLTSFTPEKVKITNELGSLTKPEFKTHPEYGALPFNAPCQDCMELLQKRDETHRYFVKEGTNGKKFYQQTAYSPLSYYDESNVLRTIDYRMKPSKQQGVFQAEHQPFPVTINIPEKFTSILNKGKELQMNRNVTIYIKHSDGSVTSLGEPNWSDYSAGDNGVVIHNFYPGIDLQMQAGGGNIETFYRLNKPLHLSDGWLVISDNIKLPQGFVYDYSHSEKMDNNYYAGSLYINSPQGTNYFFIGAPAAYDENNQIENAINLNYQINEKGAYDFYVPISWMNDTKRSYPVLIDPLVMATSSVPAASINSSYNATCFAGGCPTLLNVTVPPGCAITEITTTFWYRAFNPCGINAGGWNITYGSCRFPQGSTWNTCGLPISGLCQLTNLSVDSDFKSCLPVGCPPATLPFTLNFARCTATGSACSSSCIVGDIVTPTPWSVTVSGTMPVVTAQGGAACQGSSANLTASADSGVAPYSYSWLPTSGLNNPNIQNPTATPSVTTTYTVTVSTCGGQATATATATVTLGNLPTIAGPDTSICLGNTVTLKATGGNSFTWSPTTGLSNPNIANPVATPTVTTTYTVNATTGSCVGSATVTVVVNSVISHPPNLSVISVYPFDSLPPYSIIAGDSVVFQVQASGVSNTTVYLTGSSALLNGGFNVSFSAPDSSVTGSLTRTFKYVSSCSDASATPYHIIFTGSGEKNSPCATGIDTTYSVYITVNAPSANLLDSIPNIFTPNGDGLNDSLTLYHVGNNPLLYVTKSTLCWSDFHIKIFNRWGELQYEETSNTGFSWNGVNKSGTKVSEGVYYYIITANFAGKGVTKRGTVNVKM